MTQAIATSSISGVNFMGLVQSQDGLMGNSEVAQQPLHKHLCLHHPPDSLLHACIQAHRLCAQPSCSFAELRPS